MSFICTEEGGFRGLPLQRRPLYYTSEPPLYTRIVAFTTLVLCFSKSVPMSSLGGVGTNPAGGTARGRGGMGSGKKGDHPTTCCNQNYFILVCFTILGFQVSFLWNKEYCD